MTLDEMLCFSGGVLGPALVAIEVGNALRGVPELSRSVTRPSQPSVDDLLASVFVYEDSEDL